MTQQDPHDLPRQLLERLPLFLTLSEKDRLALAPKMQRRSFKAGETLVEQGTMPPALLILTTGVLAALQRHEATDTEVFRLAPGDCFALAAVLTDGKALFTVKALTKAVVYEIANQDLAPILKERPAIATELSQVMARRMVASQTRLTELDKGEEHPDTLAEPLSWPS